MDTNTVNEFVYAGRFSPVQLMTVGLLAACLIAFLSWREAGRNQAWRTLLRIALRWTALAVVLWMLAEPTSRTMIERYQVKSIALLADVSASMTVADVQAEHSSVAPISRIANVTKVLDDAEQSWLAPLESKTHVLRYTFSNSLKPMAGRSWDSLVDRDASQGSMSTDLAVALQDVVRQSAGQNLKAIVLLSDGSHNGLKDPLKIAGGMTDLPVYTIPVGNPTPLRDLYLHQTRCPRVVLQDDLIVVDTVLDAHGCAGEDAVIELALNDQVVDSVRRIVPTDAYTTRITMTCKAEQLGSHELILRVISVPDEITTQNNQTKLGVEVTEGKIRVLLADRQPRWEYRYLRNLFRRDEQVELDYVQLSPPSAGSTYGRMFKALPSKLEDWSRYSVIILGDVGPDDLSLSQQEQLVRYVDRRGGTIILIAGSEHMPFSYDAQPLGRLIPVRSPLVPAAPSGKQLMLTVTAEGASLPLTQLADDPFTSERLWYEQFSQQTAIGKLSAYWQPKSTAHVLIRADLAGEVSPTAGNVRSFLCWQRYGRGRVAFLGAPVTYRLRKWQGDNYHHRFWGQFLRWAVARDMASGSETVRLVTDKPRYLKGEEVQVMVQLSLPNGEPIVAMDAEVIARSEQKEVARVAVSPDPDVPGTNRATLGGLPLGAFDLEIAGPEINALLEDEGVTEPVTTSIVVEPADSIEMRNTRCNLPLLTQIAKTTGGRLLSADDLPDELNQLDLTPKVSRSYSQRPLWNRWQYLWLVVACLSLEWVIRKLSGLI